jgi:hypothetical protein
MRRLQGLPRSDTSEGIAELISPCYHLVPCHRHDIKGPEQTYSDVNDFSKLSLHMVCNRNTTSAPAREWKARARKVQGPVPSTDKISDASRTAGGSSELGIAHESSHGCPVPGIHHKPVVPTTSVMPNNPSRWHLADKLLRGRSQSRLSESYPSLIGQPPKLNAWESLGRVFSATFCMFSALLGTIPTSICPRMSG